jgi:repressor LexA
MDKHKQKIIDFFQEHRRMPGYKELLAITGFKSKNAVYKLLNKLVEVGVLEKSREGKISLARAVDEVPLLGLVEAGFPTMVEEAALDTLNLDNFLVQDRGATYLLEVKGDSMIDAGIQEGDLVLVEKGKAAKLGDIVIAQVDGDYTMKYYRQKGNQAYLEPANKKYKNIYPTTDLQISAVVRAVIRKY